MSKKAKRQTGNSREAAITANRKRHRRRRKRNYALYYILLFLFVAIAGVVLSLTVLFNIQEILVTGTEVIDVEQVIAVSGVKISDNLFRINTESVREKLLDAFDQADSVTVKRKLPNALSIEIIDGVTEINLLTDDGYAYLSHSGRVLADKMPESYPGALVVKGVKGVPEKGEFLKEKSTKTLEMLFELQESLSQEEFEGVTEIDITNQSKITLKYDDRIEIILGTMAELDYKITAAKAVIEQEGEEARGVISFMQDSNRVHFKPDFSTPEVSDPGAENTAESENTAG